MKKLFAFVLAALCSAAHAGFADEATKNPISGAPSSSSPTNITIVGGQVDRTVVHGFGRGVRLNDAITQIVPRTFNVKLIGISDSVKVDWQGGRDWVTVLTEAIAGVPGMQVEVDQTNKLVSLRIAATASSTTASGAVVPVKEWSVLITDNMLSTAMVRWGREAGFQVIWESAKDFPVMAEATFAGRFEDAVNAIVESLAASDAPVRAIYYANKVVRIVRYDGQTSDLRR